MTFRVGQKVVCATIEGWEQKYGPIPELEKGRIYTIERHGTHSRYPGLPCVHLVNVKRYNGTDEPFAASRFRPVVERKTDISVFTEILRKATKPARTPAMSQHQRGSENG